MVRNWWQRLFPRQTHSSKRAFRKAAKRFERPRLAPQVERLEDRLAPAVTAVLNAGTLTVTLGAAGDTATLTGTTTAGSDIQVAGTGFAATTFSGVTAVTVQDAGANAGQAVTFTSSGTNAISLSGAISVT